MKRRNVLASLASIFGVGVARAQEAPKLSTPTRYLFSKLAWENGPCQFSPDGSSLECEEGKAKPDQCPVCGTIAKPYHAGVKHVRTYRACAPNETASAGPTMCWDAREEPEPKSKICRCKHCNAAFWQDAV